MDFEKIFVGFMLAIIVVVLAVVLFALHNQHERNARCEAAGGVFISSYVSSGKYASSIDVGCIQRDAFVKMEKK